jgi:PleD family two-component response regulator
MGNGDSVEALLRRAEEAMFSAKAAGGDRYALDPQAVFVGERIANG